MALTPPPVEPVVVAEESVISVPDVSEELVADVSVLVASRCSPQPSAAIRRSEEEMCVRNRMAGPRAQRVPAVMTYVTKGAGGGL